MKEIDISELLGIWFHDAKISKIGLDYIKREVELKCTIPVGFWNSPNLLGVTEGEVKGTLLITGLLYFVMEPPDAHYPYEDGKGLEVTCDGPATTEDFKKRYAEHLAKMPQDLPDEAFLHWIYVVD